MERERERECYMYIYIYIYICSLILAVSVGFFCISHALFHTQLSHTPSLTHNFVTHTIFLCHPPSFTHNFVTDTIFLCHTPSFTHHFVAHNSSHRTCFTSWSSITSFVFPSFPLPPINICGSLLEEVDLWCFPGLEFVYRIYHNLIYV